tara:strand:+ start:366 stop:602 length:237 start_codon:yes stop_codon:yes gene_type:complete
MFTPGNDGQMQEQIDISKTSAIECESCGGVTFKQTLLLRKLSALVSPSGQETIVPMSVFACEKCGHVNKEFSDVSALQ